MKDSVFVNCPFDDDFKPLFEAIVFTVMASGYRLRCALEENSSGDIRFDKLCRLIDVSDFSIHDLSRTELGAADLPRFNMPFELGLFMGAKRFGGKKHKRKSALILVGQPYQLPIYLSDLAGNDPAAHRSEPAEVIRQVRRYLHEGPEGIQLPGTKTLQTEFERFKRRLPDLAEALGIAPEEIDPFLEYRSYISLLEGYLAEV